MAVLATSVSGTKENVALGGQGTPRRTRVALACQRCKSRKQKCDGMRPSCSNCTSFEAECIYIKPARQQGRARDEDALAAEARVAELESILIREGLLDEGQTWSQRQSWRSPEQSGGLSEPDSPRRTQKRPRSEHREKPASNEAERESESRESETTEPTSVVEILRDLSLEASGFYVGASSSITLSRMLGSVVKGGSAQRFHTNATKDKHLTPKSLSESGPEDDGMIDTADIPQDIADKLLNGYLKHISTRWPIFHSAYLRQLHARRASLQDPYERCSLYLVYASGGRFLETTGETGAFFCDRHHTAAMEYVDELFQCHDVRSVQILISLAIYSLRAPQGPGAWTYIGLAMRACINLGMHRKFVAKGCTLFETEMRKRIFWTCYILDRQISIILGRPFAISDRDLDAELPLELNEAEEEVSIFEAQAAIATQRTGQPHQAPAKSTTLSCFIHICRLRRIESHIQQNIYRIDKSSGASEQEVEAFVKQLDQWKDGIPADARQHYGDKVTAGGKTMIVDGYGYYMVYYYKCLRFLLHPLLSVTETKLSLIQKCAEACGGVCETYKRLHRNVSVGFSLMALHSVFLAGLTLVYCVWIAPQDLFSITNSTGMNACSIVLYIITERWPGAKKYRDMYEAIKESVLESIEEGKYEPRRPIKRLNPGLLSSIDRNEEGGEEITQMVADMAGEPICAVDGGFSIDTPGAASYYQHFPNDLPLQLHATTLEFPTQTLFDPSLTGFQDFDFTNGFDEEGFDTGPVDFRINY